MPGAKVRVVLFLSVVAVAPDGCGGQLTGNHAGGAGNGGSTARGGTTGSGSGGLSGSGGVSGSAGASDAGGTTFGEPACLSTVMRGIQCGPQDQQLCYKTCGPERTGVKAVMCSTAGTYTEMSGCAFDPYRDYSCYAIPSAANAACPTDVTPQASQSCDLPHCTLCNSLGGLYGGQFIDSTGAPKVGWCTCQVPNAAGVRIWTCASDTAWPCPLGAGCGPGTADGGGFDDNTCTSTVAKGAACGPADQQGCFQPCGPGQTGVNALMCIAGVYTEMSSCR